MTEVKAQKAKASFEDAKKYALDKIHEAYTQSDDAVRNKLDQMFANARTSSPRLEVVVDPQSKSDLEFSRVGIESMLTDWAASLEKLTVSGDLEGALATAQTNTARVKTILDDLAFALNALAPQLTTIIGGRTNVSGARANLTAAGEKLRVADADYLIALGELGLKRAGATRGDVDSQKAARDRAQASIDKVDAEIAKTLIRAPFSGTVTKIDLKVGQSVAADAALVAMISESDFQIEANAPEADIAKIKLGDRARTTLDAYGDEVIFEARVIKIDPAETLVDSVATYKITLAFVTKDTRVRSGMTANVDLASDVREGVLAIPQRAVTSKDGKKIVRLVRPDGSLEEREVTLGLRGSDGMVEVMAGLAEGNQIVASAVEK